MALLDLFKQRRPSAYGLAALSVATALGAELLLAQVAHGTPSTMLFALSVAVSAWYGGAIPGLLALLLSGIAVDYLVVEPGTLFRFSSPGPAAAFALYLTGWLGFCLLCERTLRRMRKDSQARRSAEQSANQSDRLAQLTTALGQARTPTAAIEAAIQEPLHALEADAGLLLLTSSDGRTGEVVRAVGCGADEPGLRSEISLAERSPIADAVGRGAPVILDAAAVKSSEYRHGGDLAQCPDFLALAAVPLVVGSRVVAVVQLEFRRPRFFTPDDLDYLFVLGTRAAQALDRTWQYEFAQRARAGAESLRARADQELADRQEIELALRASEARYRTLAARTSRLHGLTAALSEAVTLKDVAKVVVRQGKVTVGATTGDVTLLVEDGTAFETLYADVVGENGTAGGRFPVEGGLCSTRAVQTRRPVFVGSFAEWQELYWRSASIAADGGYVSSATLPLLSDGRAIGALAFHFTAPVNFDDDYQTLLVSVAQHCAQALDRAKLYESAQRARSDAEIANRHKDEFVSIVSHELRNPLNAMLGWTSMLQKGAKDPTLTTRALQAIHDNATRQAKLIDDLLDFSRMIGGRLVLEREDVDVRQLVRNVIESMIPAAAAKGLDMRLSSVPAVRVMGDLRRLEQVFFNLLGNALKFTPQGGRIEVDVTVANGAVELRVTDTGVGIEPEFLPHVFGRFRQADSATSRTYGGLGLGLSIARELVEAHSGSITVESAGKGTGSTFIVSLPANTLGRDESAHDHRSPAASPPVRLDGIRVLVVDDESDSRDVIAQALEDCGARVTMAGNTREAIQILEQQDMDVLLADVAMPEEDGYALIRRVRAYADGRVASIPAAAVTARAGDEEKRQALAAGFHLHLAKPFEPAELARTVEMLVRGSSLVH
jgi:signal transduction histidine kinase